MTNNELKYYEKLKHKKYRDEEGKFLIEGVHLIEECLKSELYKDQIEIVFVRNDFIDKALIEKIEKQIPDADIVFLEVKKFNKLSETENSQGVIAAINKLSDQSKIINQKSKITIALDHINDPGNLGTIIRTCHWFGVNKILISKNSADIYNPKVIRSSQGALFHVDILNEADLVKGIDELHKDGYQIMLTDLNAKDYLSEINFDKSKNYVLVLGSEVGGVSQELIKNENYSKVKIKGFSEGESLNVAVSAGIILYELRKSI